jgi:hypothetical protein
LVRIANHAEIHENRFVKPPGPKLSQLEKIAPAASLSVSLVFFLYPNRKIFHSFACDRRIPFKGTRSSNEPA